MSIENDITKPISADEEKALIERFNSVTLRLENAIAASGRKGSKVQLVAVSKWHSAHSIISIARHCNKLGVKAVFSENYMQEALLKQSFIAANAPELNIEWHFTGHLQSKKAKQAAGHFGLIHTLDTLSLAQNLQKIMEKQDNTLPEANLQSPLPLKQPVLVQVNLGQEASKSGLEEADVESFFEQLRAFTALDVQGLMCLPPYDENAEKSRPYFAALRQIRDRLELKLGIKLPHLSMGMSHDFEVAVQEGATLVRVGTDIFGPRQY
ncbi:YggS family pyridoxal phosphate-dependent enzyme [Desulfovibrio sp. OttesenSCG-928-F07]|nr:YggS family pyridoxal phosphate-dependent enzyme [Desulfovibrio sp. OttesenSCG-928-F07]